MVTKFPLQVKAVEGKMGPLLAGKLIQVITPGFMQVSLNCNGVHGV